MQTATCLDALKSDDDEYLAPKVTKVPGGRRYLYSRACYSWTVSPPRHPSLRFLNLDPPSVHQDPKVSTCGSQPAAVLTCLPQRKTLPSWWRLRTSDVGLAWAKALRSQKTAGYWGHQVTFSGNYLDPSVCEDDETVGRRYLYAPPSEISGFIKIHLDRWEPDEASSLEREGLIFDRFMNWMNEINKIISMLYFEVSCGHFYTKYRNRSQAGTFVFVTWRLMNTWMTTYLMHNMLTFIEKNNIITELD